MEITIIDNQDKFNELAFKYGNAGQADRCNLVNARVTCNIALPEIRSIVNDGIHVAFKNVTFEKDFNINGRRSIGLLKYIDCTFSRKMNLLGITFQQVEINSSKFLNHVNFSNSIFLNGVTITENDFLSEAIFSECSFSDITGIKNNDFYKFCSFLDNKFQKDVNFRGNSFKEGVSFNDSVFQGKFNGWGISSHINLVDFSRVTFLKDSFLTQSHFFGGLSLYAIIIKETLDLSDIKVYGDNSDSETLRIIKNFFLKQNNRIQAIKFHEKEMNAYRKELKVFYKRCKESLIKHNNTNGLEANEKNHINNIAIAEFKEAKKNYKRDNIILWLNKITNNYGLSWAKALGFILYTSLAFYFLYVLSSIVLGNYPYKFGWNGWSEFWNGAGYTSKYYLQFLWPTHKFDFMIGVKSSLLSYLIDILARITIGFGIYQMIQAFRKFGKI